MLVAAYLIVGLVITNSKWISKPITDVVGGSSLYGTKTLQLITWLLFTLIFSMILAIFGLGKNQSITNLNNWSQDRLSDFLKVTAQMLGRLTFSDVILVTLFGIFLSRCFAFVLIYIIDNSATNGKSSADLLSGLNQSVILVFTFIVIIFMGYIANKKFGLIAAIASIIPGGFFTLLNLCISKIEISFGLPTFLTNSTLILIINLVLLLIFYSLIKTSRVTTSGLKNLGIYAGIFSLVSRVPGTVDSLNYYEDSHFLNSYAFRNWEYKPWSDLQMNHGIYHDLIRPLFGNLLIDNSIWGMQAGISSFIFPLEVCLVLYLVSKILDVGLQPVYLFLGYCALNMTFPIDGSNSWIFLYSIPRAIPLLFCTYALKRIFKNETFQNLLFLVICLWVTIVWAPENLIIYILSITASAYYFIKWSRTRRYIQIVKILFITFIPVLLSVISLNQINLLQPFLDDFGGLSSNLLQGALPFNFRNGATYTFFVFFLPLFFVFVAGYYAARLKSGLQSIEILIFPSVILGLYYFVKFLAWPDLHIQQSVNVMSLVWVFFAGILIKKFKNFGDFYIHLKFAAGTLVIFALVMNMAPTRQLLPKMEGTKVEVVGFIGPKLLPDYESLNALKKRIQQITDKENPIVLDLSNAPVSVHLMTNLRFVSDVAFSSFYVSRIQQHNAVMKLKNHPPDAVVLSGPFGYGRDVFPGEMYQRNYLISQHIFSNFTHVTSFGDYTLLTAGGLNMNLKNASEFLNEDYSGCNWSKALNYVPDLAELRLDEDRRFNLSESGEVVSEENIFFHQVKGVFVTVSKNGLHSVSANDGSISVNFEIRNLDLQQQANQEIYVPLETCPIWALNGSRIINVQIDGQGASVKSVSIRK